MMRRLPAFIVAVAALIATAPALAQTRQNEITAAPPNFPIQRQCINQAGQAVPCSFSDIPAPDVAPPFTAPSADKRGMVVSISPNSGATGQYPSNAIPITGIGAGSTAAVVGTLAASPNRKTYICGFDVSSVGGTAESSPIVIAGLVGGSFTYQVPVNATGGQGLVNRTFTPCIPASALNTAITVTTTAAVGGTAVDVNAWGFQQ